MTMTTDIMPNPFCHQYSELKLRSLTTISSDIAAYGKQEPYMQ